MSAAWHLAADTSRIASAVQTWKGSPMPTKKRPDPKIRSIVNGKCNCRKRSKLPVKLYTLAERYMGCDLCIDAKDKALCEAGLYINGLHAMLKEARDMLGTNAKLLEHYSRKQDEFRTIIGKLLEHVPTHAPKAVTQEARLLCLEE
jgi:hypothetical protein